MGTLPRWTNDTHSNRAVCRSDSSPSPTVPPGSILSRPRRARTDSIFPCTPGTFYRRVNGSLIAHTRYFTSCSFKNVSKDDLPPISADGGDNLRKLTVNCATWLSIDRCCDSYPKHVNHARCRRSSDSAHLVDEDCLPKILDELDDGGRVLGFVQDPGGRPFL